MPTTHHDSLLEEAAVHEGHGWNPDDTGHACTAQMHPLEQMPATLWTTDRDLRVSSLSGSGVDGLYPGVSLADFFAEAESDAMSAHRGALARRSLTFEFSRNNRTYFGRVEPFYDSWGLVGTVANVLDITEHVVLEAARRDREAMALDLRKTQSLTALAGGVAHNFNNLLTAIVGYTSLALMRVGEDSPLRDILREVESAASCAAELAGQMLVYAQRQKLNNDPINLSSLAEGEAAFLVPSHGTNVKLTCELARNLPLVDGDADQLQRLVRTLLLNAAEAIGEANGTVLLRTSVVHAERDFLADTFPGESLPRGRYVLLQVGDDGCGMDEETRSRIFEPFFSTKFVGRGMGLAAAFGIVRGHHGAIAVASKPGAGTTVKVLLPATR